MNRDTHVPTKSFILPLNILLSTNLHTLMLQTCSFQAACASCMLSKCNVCPSREWTWCNHIFVQKYAITIKRCVFCDIGQRRMRFIHMMTHICSAMLPPSDSVLNHSSLPNLCNQHKICTLEINFIYPFDPILCAHFFIHFCPFGSFEWLIDDKVYR